MATTPPQLAGPKGGRKLTIAFGPLINVQVALGTFREPKAAISGRTVCREHMAPVAQAARCTAEEHICDETLSAYEVPGGFVEVDTKALESERSGLLEVDTVVPFDQIDPIYLEKTYLLWPQPGAERAFDVFAATFRATGRAAIGTAVLSKATQAFVIRWSEVADTLVAHVCCYDELLRWHDARTVSEASHARPEPSEAEVAMASELLNVTLAGEFDPSQYHNEYMAALGQAIEAAAAGKPMPKVDKVSEPEPVADLMAALQASVTTAAKAKAKSNGKGTTKRARKVAA